MKFNVVIEIKGAAFFDPAEDSSPSYELARILNRLATELALKGMGEMKGSKDVLLHDINGNKVGRAFVSGK